MEGIFQKAIAQSKLIWQLKGCITITNAIRNKVDNITSGLEKKKHKFYVVYLHILSRLPENCPIFTM